MHRRLRLEQTDRHVAYAVLSTDGSGKQEPIAIPVTIQFVQSIQHLCIDAIPAHKICWTRDNLQNNSFLSIFHIKLLKN